MIAIAYDSCSFDGNSPTHQSFHTVQHLLDYLDEYSLVNVTSDRSEHEYRREQLADASEERFRAGVLDVISLNGLADDTQHDVIVNGLLPELRKRKIVKPDYTGSTLRENLGLELPPLPIAAERPKGASR